MIHRRRFLQQTLLASAGGISLSGAATTCDVVVYGATAAGVLAAVEAARHGHSAMLIEPGQHVGGMTSVGLGATDYARKESIGGLAREFYAQVKRYYANDAAWTYERRQNYRAHGYDPAEDQHANSWLRASQCRNQSTCRFRACAQIEKGKLTKGGIVSNESHCGSVRHPYGYRSLRLPADSSL